MDCPVCKNPMIVLELREVEIDFCSGCSGIWLDSGELEMLLSDGQKAQELLNSFAVDPECAEKKRRCPICGKKMLKVIVGESEPTVLIDKCPGGDGLWFGGGELHDIFDRAQFDEENKIKELLNDMFSQ